MTNLIFIEGVSGVGKSTMVRAVAEELRAQGYRVKEYVEFDYNNPIDFYCTAYVPLEEYEKLCAEYKLARDAIQANTIIAGNVRLVRYYDEDTPLFEEPLLSELTQREFCYKPSRLVPIEDYTAAYAEVWRNFAASLNETDDFILFDGSLLHHPINDMMRNYHIGGEQAVSHVGTLLNALGTRRRQIFYLQTDDIGAQLTRAHSDRGQSTSTGEQIHFWEERYRNDMLVLGSLQEDYHIYNVSNNGWDSAKERILKLCY